MINKIKHKLFLNFLLFSSISILAVVTSVWFYQKKEKISTIAKEFDDIYILSLKTFKIQQDFLNYEVINPDFFKTNQSLILNKEKEVFDEILIKTKKLLKRKDTASINVNGDLDRIQLELKMNKKIFKEVVELLKRRGFHDFGIEGKMRYHAHALMALGADIEQVKILMLRRHEKDFIIRKEDEYVNKFNLLIVEVENEIEHNNSIGIEKKKNILKTVDNYYLSFKKLVSIERKLGVKGQTGLLLELSDNINRIQNYFELEKEYAHQSELSIYNNLNVIAIVTSILIIILTIVLSYIFATAFTKPLTSLADSIKKYVNSDFSIFPINKIKYGNYEIDILADNFLIMSYEITSHINYFKEKVEERTHEILVQKDEILKQKDKIVRQRDQLKTQKEILEIQKKAVIEKNNNIMDSIRYAKRIQNAILPPSEVIQSLLPDSFIYYQPKDIVSGDFYWVDQINSAVLTGNSTKKILKSNTNLIANSTEIWLNEFDNETQMQMVELSEKILFAVVDCTGHGVPGALMSIIGYNSLNKIISSHNLSEPAAILDQLNQEVQQTLRQNGDHSEVKDGMDIALCSLDLTNNTLQFSGANTPLFMIRNKQLKIIKGDRIPIGLHYGDENQSFTNHTVCLQKGDTVYLFSDGYVDQFGGPKGKKFKIKQFKELLLSIQEKSMFEQKNILKKTIEEWKGNSYQVDDILVIGVRI